MFGLVVMMSISTQTTTENIDKMTLEVMLKQGVMLLKFGHSEKATKI